MEWYAVEVLDKAFKRTKQLLYPFNKGTWLRLAIIVFFTGGSLGFFNPFNFVSGYSDFEGQESYNSSDSVELPENIEERENTITGLSTASESLDSSIIFGVAIFLALLIGIFGYISSVFEFIYFQSLIDEDVSIRKNFSKHKLNGAKYLGFRVLYLLGLIGLIALTVLGFSLNVFAGFLTFLIVLILFLALVLVSLLVHDFVLIKIIQEGKGIKAGLDDIFSEVRSSWKQILAYILVKVGIGMVVGIAVSGLMLVILIPILLVFGIMGVLFGLVSDILVLIPVVLGLIVLIALGFGLSIVTRTFIYSYMLEFYKELFE